MYGWYYIVICVRERFNWGLRDVENKSRRRDEFVNKI